MQPIITKEAFEEISEYIDVLFLNVKYDSKIVIDTASIDHTMKYLWDLGISTVIIKSTEEKTYYVGNNGKIETVKFIDGEVMDDTGAGDAFNGGVLHGLANGMSAYKAATLGSIVAGLQIRGIGAIKSIPYKDDVYSIFKGQND